MSHDGLPNTVPSSSAVLNVTVAEFVPSPIVTEGADGPPPESNTNTTSPFAVEEPTD